MAVCEGGSKTGIGLRLVGEDGNAFAILGRAVRALRENGRGDLVDEFLKEAKSGDYNHLLCTCMDYFECDGEEGEEGDDE